MPRGIVPVTALLIIASAFSQFGATSAPVAFTHATQTSQRPPGSPPGIAPAGKTRFVPTSASAEVCKDLYSCVPRSDLGPWVASCNYVQAEQGDIARSPMVALNLGKPVSGKLPPIANVPEIGDPSRVSDASSEDKNSLDRWCLSRAALAITSLIVTLPDPVTSHLVLDFDRRIDAIQAAALDAGYVIDQFWLPWVMADTPLPDDFEKAGKER